MKNEEKYKTVVERKKAYDVFCRTQKCHSCPCYAPHKRSGLHCILNWLELEYEDKYDTLFTVEPYAGIFRVRCGKEEIFTVSMESVGKEICARLNYIARKWHRELCEKGETR